MKKIVLPLLLLGVGMTLNAQTIVDTTPQNRNVLLEEFSGNSWMGWDPAGHQVADQIMDSLSGHAWIINIHPIANDNRPYYTQYGYELMNQANVSAYPNATFNRHVFSGFSSYTSIGNRNLWQEAANEVRTMSAPVNIAAQGSIDVATRTLTLHVEAYYTAASAQATNLLNIAVIQDNIIGEQTVFGAAVYPEMTVGDQYRHMHVLRDLITGQWGFEIPATQGSFIDTTITYTIPFAYGNSNGDVPAALSDLSFIVFVTETHQEVLNVTKAQVALDKASFNGMTVEREDCSLTYNTYATVNNCTMDTITNFTFDCNGSTITSTKILYPFETDTFNMSSVTFVVNGSPVQHCVDSAYASLVSYTKQGGVTVNVNSVVDTVFFGDIDIYTVAGPLTARIGLDYYASEASIELLSQTDCQTLWTHGNWSNFPGGSSWNTASDIPDAQYYILEFSPAAAGLYILRAVDSYGDGWMYTNDTVVSGIWLSNASGLITADSMGYTAAKSFRQRDYYLNITNAGDGSHSIREDLRVVTVEASDSTLGAVTGGGNYHEGDHVSLAVYPQGGTTFMGWSNGSNDNPLTIVVTTDTTIIANLVLAIELHDTITLTVHDTLYLRDTVTIHDTIIIHDTIVTSIGDVQSIDARIYTDEGQVVVEGTEGQTVTLFDAVGRIVSTRRENFSAVRFDIPTSGVYLVKIGNLPARRIVVVR